ncbi:ATP-binding protein [Pseudomonas sp. PDM26]|uniref:DEAD/DEAH box helicase n=1 Tax=Pseudomonas sp. PDM26 TaxID=2854766 RepID=UPI001C470699|nr:AAA domain-containing protein [Pseudomonas sp. PDM26]MBV7547275.1 ATP-binding protein [Pseudomonas sp. PDM26]
MTSPAAIVRYWQSVELLQPMAAPKPKQGGSPLIYAMSAANLVMPWVNPIVLAKHPLPPGKKWSHLLFGHCYDRKHAVTALAAACGADLGPKIPQNETVALFSLRFTDTGHMVPDSLVLSSAAWLLGKVRANEPFARGFADEQQWALKEVTKGFDEVVTAQNILWLTELLLEKWKLKDLDAEEKSFLFRSTQINPTQAVPGDGPMNSFFLEELADVADSMDLKGSSAPLKAYLAGHTKAGQIDVSDDGKSKELLDLLGPDRYPGGCWPTEADQGLVHSQQLAVNHIVGELGESDGLRSVNGPPGTGKTTLLRDIIAAVVTDRADVLAELPSASGAFGKDEALNVLIPELLGHEIVVASSNNGAVENVTLELPQRDKVDAQWLSELDYFRGASEWLTGKEAWGLISAALGSKTNRHDFVDRFYEGKGKTSKGADVPATGAGADVSDGPSVTDTDQVQGTGGAGSAAKFEGFKKWLDKKASHNKQESAADSQYRKTTWLAAVKRYKKAKAKAEAVGAEAVMVSSKVKALMEVRGQVQSTTRQIDHLKIRRSEFTEIDWTIEEDFSNTHKRAQAREDQIQRHRKSEPGFWSKLFSLWSNYVKWKVALNSLQKALDETESEIAIIVQKWKRLRGEREEHDKLLAASESALQEFERVLATRKGELKTLAEKYKANHFLHWLERDRIGRGEEIELAEPWMVPGWRRARARVFIEALHLHRTFFELEPNRVRNNLNVVTRILKGSPNSEVSQDAIRSAWATLFMVVPVVSSTFASFARTFSTLGAGQIGWLLVDEAGQATPQAAVGALWRSRRAVLVGDPLQLKPILSVSDAELEYMRQLLGVDPCWNPSGQSAQSVADRGSAVGKMLGPAGMKNWVGLPLVVHRRCDRPMFKLANKIAYDGAMVYGTSTPSPEKETPATLPTGWINVCGPSNGNWVEEEGGKLKVLLARLKEEGVAAKDISVITPYQDVRQRLGAMLKSPMVFGTIHTMQGKESSVVVLVLGGNTESGGARDWAVSEPNLVNVAATRAKRRLYVIGDRADWSKRPIFREVMHLLPEIRISTPSTGTQAGGAQAMPSVP